MKLDSDTLAKNQFWILFGILVPLIFGTMIWLATVSASSNDEKKRELEEHKAGGVFVRHRAEIARLMLLLRAHIERCAGVPGGR